MPHGFVPVSASLPQEGEHAWAMAVAEDVVPGQRPESSLNTDPLQSSGLD